MPTLQVLEINEEESRVTALWDCLVSLNHHKSDSEDYITKLIREYPEDDITRFKVLCDAGIEKPHTSDGFLGAGEIIEFEIQQSEVPTYESFMEEVEL